MHPLRERICDELFADPALATPPPEPERPRPPRVRKPREFKLVGKQPQEQQKSGTTPSQVREVQELGGDNLRKRPYQADFPNQDPSTNQAPSPNPDPNKKPKVGMQPQDQQKSGTTSIQVWEVQGQGGDNLRKRPYQADSSNQYPQKKPKVGMQPQEQQKSGTTPTQVREDQGQGGDNPRKRPYQADSSNQDSYKKPKIGKFPQDHQESEKPQTQVRESQGQGGTANQRKRSYPTYSGSSQDPSLSQERTISQDPRKQLKPPKFILLTDQFYALWCNHQKELQMAKHKVDDRPPALFPELYLKPRRLDFYARQLEANMDVNKELLKRINLIQRTGGFVDCWMKPEPTNKLNKLMCQQRQRELNELQKKNAYFHTRLLKARSEQLLTKELDEEWKHTKHKLILGASLPFILFKTGTIHRDMHDPAFDKPANVTRSKIAMDIWVMSGSKIGKVIVELFTDICPKTCQMFLNLVKGDRHGYAYTGTRLFRVVPELYCRGGDVVKDNGFGCYLPEGVAIPMGAENYKLNHTVPGVLSMVVTKDNEVCGQFNIIFKPLPQFDGKHVVFGRIVSGPVQALERISAQGLPLGTTTSDCVVRSCGWYRKGRYHPGSPNTIKFPPRRKPKK